MEVAVPAARSSASSATRPVGSPAEVAEAVRPYLAAGATHVNLAPVSAAIEEAVDGVAEVRRLLVAA